MRKRWIVAAAMLAAGCSRAPDPAEAPDLAGNATAGVAFRYGYAFELPSRSIGDLQEAHAQACERAGVATCRITGLSYTVDRDGEAHASLSVRLAAGVARRFGRDAVALGDPLGATLVGADITGEDVASSATTAEAAGRDAAADLAAIDRTLADPRTTAAERTELRARRESRVAASRELATVASSAAERLANTPMTFSYQPGHGVGLVNALRDTGATALSSTRVTLIWAIWLLASLGPPAIVLLLLWLSWRHWGRRLWRRLADAPAD